MKGMMALRQGKIQPPSATGPEHHRLLRPKECTTSVYFSLTIGDQRRPEVVGLEKADLAMVGKEGHPRACQNGISGKAHYVSKRLL